LVSSITGAPVQYAGGGGAGFYRGFGSLPGLGGGGGAGDGAFVFNTNGNPGIANTGGGAGGATTDYVANGAFATAGSPGGSGIVVIRYPSFYAAPTSVTGSPSVNVINGFRIYTWTGSGSITF
jgi:hypothetical protein